PVKTTNYQYFFSDKMGDKVVGATDSFYFEAGEVGAPDSIQIRNYSYPVNKGAFVYNAVGSGQMTAYYFYSDGYFADSARYYNEHLVTMSNAVAMAAVTTEIKGEYTEAKAAKNIVDLFASAGFKDIYVHYPEPEYFGEDSEILSTIGYVIASKDITIGGYTQPLIAIAVRGGEYGAEWASNVTLGEGVGESKGFGDAANQVEQGIYNYINSFGINDYSAKFWISGFSRAGATSNLVAKRLTDTYGENNVYAFCFEAPKGGVYSELKTGLSYANIHCIINASDIVPHVGTTEMGFIRYGVDHKLPYYSTQTSEYNIQREKAIAQLAAINPTVAFNDKFSMAEIYYIGNTIFGWAGWDLIEKVDGAYDTAEEWNPAFIKSLQEASLSSSVSGSIYNRNSVNWHGYRNYWSGYKWYLYEENDELLIKCYDTEPSDIETGKYTVLTLEDSIVNIMNFYYGTDSNKKQQIMDALNLDAIMGKIDKAGIWWNIIGEWNSFSIDKKNKEFNELWSSIEIEKQVASVLTPEEIKILKTSFYVVADFLLDFVGDDYLSNNQRWLGTLIYNVSNILQTHYYDVVFAWARSFDSFYASGDIVAPPVAPTPDVQSGVYDHTLYVYLTSNNDNVMIFYTTDGTDPDLSTGNCTEQSIFALPIYLPKDYVEEVTIKAIALYNGVTSEVATHHYTVTSSAFISVD
ncbi:MAG: chitobiase/beta-hexosaminidase C-terminal domain-containing protein, partial [Clostridia bacterium]|nr:chitobiase/beta-hexosaminidase C-terminal domain-containing protein [Clostridia bacterium]